MNHKRITYLTHAASIAALYVVLTLFSNVLGLANYSIQVRFSEALTILPLFTPAAIPGLYIGCLLSNLLTGCVFWDILFGPLATLLGAVGTYILGKKLKWAASLPPILSNMLIIPFILSYAYHFEGAIPYFMLTVGIGEILSCGILGNILLFALSKYRKQLFGDWN